MNENESKIKDPDNLIFGGKLKELRLRNGLSQEDLAQQLNMHSQTVSRYERGEMTPNLKILLRIATMFDVSMDWLTKDKTKPYTNQCVKIPYIDNPEKYWIADEQIRGMFLAGEDFRVYLVKDNNMSPAIQKDDLILIDIKSISLAMDKIVLIKSRSEYLVKRVIHLSDSQVQLASNSTIPPITLPTEDVVGVLHLYCREI